MKWSQRRLGDLMEFRNGLSYSAADRGKGLAIVGVANVSRGGRLPAAGFESIRVPGNLPDAALLRPGDLLFVRSNGSRELVGRCAEVIRLDQPTSHSGFTIRARVVDPEVDPKWVAAFFACGLGDGALGRGARGTNINNLRQERLQGITLPCPPPAIQDRALRLYEHFQDAIDFYDAAMRHGRRRIDGLAQVLLNGTLRFPGFKASWPVVRLGEVVDIDPPTRFRCSNDTPVSFVPMADITEGGDRVGDGEASAGSTASGYSAFFERDILVAKITPCFENGKAWLATGLRNDCGLGSTEFYVLRCTPRCLPEYLWLHVTSVRFRRKGASNMIGSAGQKRVAKAFVQNFEFHLPDLDEQRRICSLFRAMGRGLRIMERQRDCMLRLRREVFRRVFVGDLDVTRIHEANS
jgi:restriction endonuclease S subunit